MGPYGHSTGTVMARAKRRKTARKRRAVSREERHPATPETLAKLRACPLKAMLERGAHDPHDPAGMQPEQYESALEIWDAHDALVKGLKATATDAERVANAHGGLSERKADLVAVYLDWASELPHRLPLTSAIVVGWIEDTPGQRLYTDHNRRMLCRACDLWARIRRDHLRVDRVAPMHAIA